MPCQYCHATREAVQLSAHEKNCPRRPVSCFSRGEGCLWTGPQGQRAAHRDTCEYAPQTCAVPNCGVRVRRREMARHMETAAAAHVGLLCLHIVGLQERIVELENTVYSDALSSDDDDVE